MQAYRTGDKICIFGAWGLCAHPSVKQKAHWSDCRRQSGFSRGAYTARALAGLLYKVSSSVRGQAQKQYFLIS